jgi:hypothetical protein
MRNLKYFCYLGVLLMFGLLIISCQKDGAHKNVLNSSEKLIIYPDYIDVTVPYNIAPLNFQVENGGEQFHVSIKGENGKAIVCKSKKGVIDIPIRKWHKLTALNKNQKLMITVSVKNDGKWFAYQPFEVFVSEHEIDSHLSYRLINVGYILWKKMGIYQRDLTSFTEKPIMINQNSEGNCMNCHSYSNHNPEYFSFHMRGKHAGTIVSTPDSVFKVETKTNYTLASGAYTAWHPAGKHIAFSADVVRQFFHGVIKDNEVYDLASDLIVYDIEKNTVTTHPSISTKKREVLPNWSPDGKYLYFGVAPSLDDSLDYDEVFYDLMRIEYNVETNEWGKLDTIYMASNNKRTLSFPKISPDGKWIMFTDASHGYFTIYNQSSDLFLLNIADGSTYKYPYNSEKVESYHNWSSSGRWVVFSSKRLDGLTTRPFITYFDQKGKWHKPFVMPQKDPSFYKSFNLNYNIPELSKGAVKVNKQALLNAVWSEPLPANFDTSVDINALSGATKLEKESSLH